MANYYSVTRTNYFHVKDEKKFRALMGRVRGYDDDIELWDDEVDRDGNRLFGFGTYGCIAGIPDNDGYIGDDSYDRFIDALTECVADNDAILIFESGHEKLRYVGGGSLIITSSGSEYIDLQETAIQKTKQILDNKQWNSKCTC